MPYTSDPNYGYARYAGPTPAWGTGARGGYGDYPQISDTYTSAQMLSPDILNPMPPQQQLNEPNYSQLGAMLAQLGLTKLASTVSGPFAPLVAMGLQFGLQKLLGSDSQDELRKATAIRMRAQNQAIPVLQAMAQGKPTAGTRAIQEQVRQAQAASQQAQAMSAGRANQYGTAVARANQYRASLESSNALTQLLGQQQQQALGGLMQLPAVQSQTLLAQGDMLAKSNISTYIQKLMAVPDANLTETQRKIMAMYDEMRAVLPLLYNWAKIQPPTGGIYGSP